MSKSSQRDPIDTSLHSGGDHETDKEESSQRETKPLAQEYDEPLTSKLEAWMDRIKMDAALVWQSEGQLKYFRPHELNKLEKCFARSTLLWVSEQINSPDGISDETLHTVYELYILKFREIADVMAQKKKAQKVREAIENYEPHFLFGLNDGKSMRAFPSLLAEMSAFDYGQDVVFHFLCQRPDIFESI